MSQQMAEVDVIILDEGEKHYRIRTDETAKPMNIPKHGIRVISRSAGSYATISLSERTAINYNLI